jgi:hypothetical protein
LPLVQEFDEGAAASYRIENGAKGKELVQLKLRIESAEKDICEYKDRFVGKGKYHFR